MKLVSLSELKAYLNIQTTEHDDVLLMLIDMVGKRIETFLNRDLKYQTRTEKLMGDGFTSYQVRSYPIDLSQPITVKKDGTTLINGSEYFVDAEPGVIYFSTPMYTEPLKLEISYTGGYREGAEGVLQVPSDIRRAVLYQVAYEFQRRHDLGASSISMPDGSVSTSPISLLREVRSTLMPYRRIPP